MNFKIIAIFDIIALTISNFTGLFFALKGYSYWSLVLIYLTKVVINGTLLTIYTCYYYWTPTIPSLKNFKSKFNFTIFMYGNNLLNTFIENIAAIIIGKSIGKELLGTYQIAKNIAIIPASFVKNNISNILFSSFSKIQNDKDQFKNINGLILKTFSILFIPLVIFFIFCF